MAYHGGILVEIEAKLEPQKIINAFSKVIILISFLYINKNYLLPLRVKALMKRLNGKIRICWKPTEYGPSW